MASRRIVIPVAALVVAAGVSAQAQVRLRGRFAVTREAAEKAVAEGLFHEETIAPGTSVRLLADVVASVPSVPLAVIAVEPVHGLAVAVPHRAEVLVRLGCRVRAACVPFYASVTMPDIAPLPAVVVAAMANAPVVAAPSSRTARPASTGTHAAIVLRRGAQATLVLDDGSARVEMPVVTLKDAAAGESVRVASLDRRRFYAARVVSATELKGEF